MIADRKQLIRAALAPGSQSLADPGWDDVHLVPSSLPERSLADVNLSTTLLGHRLAAPIVVVPMTGGRPDATELNTVLGEAAERLGLAVGVRQPTCRARSPDCGQRWPAVRRRAPHVPVLANIGACQLVAQCNQPPLSADDLITVIDIVARDVLSIHLNVVQELVQPEGDRNTADLAAAIGAAVAASPVPVLVKETGAGMTRETAELLADSGGRHRRGRRRWRQLRPHRSHPGRSQLRSRGHRRGGVFGNWVSPRCLVARGARHPAAGGGHRRGAQRARRGQGPGAGRPAVGVGRLAIEPATRRVAELVRSLEQLIDELRMALLLSGAGRIDDLRHQPPVVTGFTLEWARQRHLL